MSLATKIASFFKVVDEVWEAVPNYVKVFLFSSLSSIIGLYYTSGLTIESVIAIVLANLGLYSIPRGSAEISKRLSK